MSDEPAREEPELISLRELARRLGVSHQLVSQLSRSDPQFPKTVPVGRSKAVDWVQAEPYFRDRVSRQGERTDLKPQARLDGEAGDGAPPGGARNDGQSTHME